MLLEQIYLLFVCTIYTTQRRHTFGIMVAGRTETRKTTFVKSYWAITLNTKTRLRKLVPSMEFQRGIPLDIFNSIKPRVGNLYILTTLLVKELILLCKCWTKNITSVTLERVPNYFVLFPNTFFGKFRFFVRNFCSFSAKLGGFKDLVWYKRNFFKKSGHLADFVEI